MYAHDEYPILDIDSSDLYDREENTLAAERVAALRIVKEAGWDAAGRYVVNGVAL